MSARPDVALDNRLTSHMSEGMKRYAREMLARLPRVAPDLRFGYCGTGDNFDFDEQVMMPLALARLRPRIVHFLGPFIPVITTAPTVITIHDVIDLQFPQFAKPKAVAYFRFIVGSALRRARRVITDDPRTARALVRMLHVNEKRIRVVPLGIDDGLGRLERWDPERPYFLYAGNHRPHKDLATLYAAWKALPPGSGVDLHVTGDDDLGAERARYARDDAQIVFRGDLSREELLRAYAGARAYVHPALMEGFGLPLLEAAATGTPVIAAIPSIPAILRETVTPFVPGEVAALTRLLTRALLDPSLRARAERSRDAALAYTWDRTARATVDVYRELL